MNIVQLGAILSLGMSTAESTVAGDYNPGAADIYTRNLLLNPSKSLLEAESRGRITIYDGLDEREVDAALDTQFGRIENMMFVRVRRTLDNGSIEENDDCD